MKSNNHNHYSRRLFFQQLILGGAGLSLFPYFSSCKSDSVELPRAAGNPPFNVWEEMLAALEMSPDHYLARFEKLTEEGDLQAMFDFIKNGMAVLPTDDYYFRNLGAGMHYGPEMALRSGMATPREKAELFKTMLERNGYTAEVVYETVDMPESAVKDILFREWTPELAPPVDSSRFREWQKALGAEGPQGTVKLMSDVDKQAEVLGDKLLNLLKPEYQQLDRPSTFRFSNSTVPGVFYEKDGVSGFAHLFDPNVELGSYHPSNTNQQHRKAREAELEDENISISLKCSTALGRRNEKELLVGNWQSSQLLGNQLKVQFLNNLTLEKQAVSTIGDISTFTPCFALQDLDGDQAVMENGSFLGEPMMLNAEKVLDDLSLTSEQQSDTSGLVNQVTSLEVIAKPKSYPQVELQLFPRNSDGEVVEGLNAADFLIKDNDRIASGWLRQNQVAPKLLLMYDTSLSMPSEYRGEEIEKFLDRTQAAIKESFPNVRIFLQETSSNIYTSHLKAAQGDYDVILYATDGHNNDTFDPAQSEIFTSGPATYYLFVQSGGQKAMDKVVENTGSTLIPAEDQEQTIIAINEAIQDLPFPPYVFRYQAFGLEDLHAVEVELLNTSIKATSEYRFQSGIEDAVADRIIGLYLDIKIGRRPVVRKVLAGWDRLLQPSAKPNTTMTEAVHEALLGSVVLSFERAGATDSVRLSEYLKTLIDQKPWFSAYQEGKFQQAAEALQKGNHSYPTPLLSMMQPLQHSITANSITYPKGYRVGMLKFTPAVFSDESKLTFDYLPFSDFTTLTRDGSGYFAANVKKTAQMALLESAYFSSSTLGGLEGIELVVNKDVRSDESYQSKALGDSYRYFRERIFRGGDINIFDKAATNRCYWNIDSKTGELYGMLPNNTAGGGEGVKIQLEHLRKVVEGYERLLAKMNLGMMVTGVGSLPIGIVATYGLTLVKLYAIASEAIIIMDGRDLSDNVQAALKELACNVYKEILYCSFGPVVGDGMSGIENLIAAMGGNYSFVSC